jgi:hypothetical protein
MTTFSKVNDKETPLLSSNRVIKKDLGGYPEDIFSNFSKTPIASGASTITSHQLFSILIVNLNPTSFVNSACSSIDEDSLNSCNVHILMRDEILCWQQVMIRPHPLTPRLPASHLVLKLPILTKLRLLLRLDLNTLPFLHFSITGSGAHRLQQRWQAQICSQGPARRTLG